MRNKANLRKIKMKINLYLTKDYGNQQLYGLQPNKPNQTQLKPISNPIPKKQVIISQEPLHRAKRIICEVKNYVKCKESREMNIRKTFFMGTVSLIVLTLLAPPVLGHRVTRPHFKGLPRRAYVEHSHVQAEAVEATTTKQSEAETFDLLAGVADIAEGTLETLGNAVDALGKTVEDLLGGEAESASTAKEQYI